MPTGTSWTSGASSEHDANRQPKHLAIIGNALPRRCGLATFTSDTVDATRARFPDLQVDHYAMDDGTGVAYPAGVTTIAVDDPKAYREAAGLIEASGAEAIWLQHEFGIFGGEAGSYILTLLDRSTLPLVVTLHTVLERPSDSERSVFERLIARASHLIVMANVGRGILRDVYGVSDAKISVIPHGVPDRAYVEPNSVKARFGLDGKKVIMTFGLLGPDKGIRHVIEAMPAVVRAEPNACYIVIGASHPNLIRQGGEAHRESLVALAAALGVGDQVRFLDLFLEQRELLDWIEACDVYVTPYLNLAQITSGTLSYAVALGKPVVSTPYVHARELLAEERGVLVPPGDAAALADAIGKLLANDGARTAMAARAYDCGRDMLWPRAIERAIGLVEEAISPAHRRFRASRGTRPTLAPDLGAVRRMTDSTGMLQHGLYSIPDRNHGYCIDDNARALILACNAAADADGDLGQLATIYASFVQHAWNPDRQSFRNFMRFDRSWCEDAGSEDSNGRALWAVGVAAARGIDRSMRDWAANLFDQTAGLAADLASPRAQAFATLGALEMLGVKPEHDLARSIVERSVATLLELLSRYRRDEWTWFEPVLAYDNARLPEALLRAGQLLGRADCTSAGLATLAWLVRVQTDEKGMFRPVGTDSFDRPYAAPLPFDQQPVEAIATIDACIAARSVSSDDKWVEAARAAYAWFTGDNLMGLPLVSRQDGGCFDGLMPHGLNRNQGAESILALQLANVAISGLVTDEPAATRADGAA